MVYQVAARRSNGGTGERNAYLPPTRPIIKWGGEISLPAFVLNFADWLSDGRTSDPKKCKETQNGPKETQSKQHKPK